MTPSLNILLSGNDPPLIHYLKHQKIALQLKFHESSVLSQPRYVLELINVDHDLTNKSQKLIHLYQHCRENNQKLVVWLIFTQKINREKVISYQHLLDTLASSQPLHRLVVTKDLYQSETSPSTPFDYQINRVLHHGSINISTKGQNYLYPTHLSDFFSALTKIFLLDSTKGHTYYILGDKITDLDFAYQTKRLLIDRIKNFQINSTQPNDLKDPEVDNLATTTQINLNWRPDTSFEVSLKKIQRFTDTPEPVSESVSANQNSFLNKISRLKYFLPKFKSQPTAIIDQTESQTLKKQTGRGLVKLFIGSIIFYLLIVALFALGLVMSLRSLNFALTSIQQGTLVDSASHLQNSQQYHQLSQALYSSIQPLFIVLGKANSQKLNNILVYENYLQDAVGNLQQTYVLADKLYLSFANRGPSVNLKDQVLALKSSLTQIYTHLQQLDLLLKTGDLPQNLLNQIKTNPLYSQLDLIQTQIIQAENLLDVLAGLEKGDSESRVLVLVQDQDELRGSGGVIRYLVLLTLSQGKLAQSTVYSQKELDALNAGSLKAPNTIKYFTGNDYWKLKDMSYLADFSQTANAMTWYFEKIVNQKPDLVVAINKSFYEKFLSIDIQNQQIKTTPSANLKTSVGENFNESLVEIINHYLTQYQSQNLKLSSLLQVLFDEINHGQFQIYIPNSDIQNTLLSQTFSGQVMLHPCHSSVAQSPTCLAQTTYLNESNFMAAPINHLLARQVTHQVTLNSRSISHNYQLKYHFLSDISVLNRDYRPYYQLYLPSDATISAILLDDQPQDLTLAEYSRVGNFNFFNFSLNLPVTKDHTLNIRFDSSVTLPTDLTQFAYSLTEIRQSGLYDLGYTLQIQLPVGTHARLVSSPVETKPQQVLYRYPAQTSTFALGLGYDR